MGRLFGTDGARGVANAELTCETAMAIGRAAAMVLLETEGHRPRVVIGKDTRISSDMLEAARWIYPPSAASARLSAPSFG